MLERWGSYNACVSSIVGDGAFFFALFSEFITPQEVNRAENAGGIGVDIDSGGHSNIKWEGII